MRLFIVGASGVCGKARVSRPLEREVTFAAPARGAGVARTLAAPRSSPWRSPSEESRRDPGWPLRAGIRRQCERAARAWIEELER